MKNTHIDMALELKERFAPAGLKGLSSELFSEDDKQITKIVISGKEAEEALGKSIGTYISIDCESISRMDDEERDSLSSLTADFISSLLPNSWSSAMVVGLGNRAMTPDALGPLTLDGLLVTRHIKGELPEAEKMATVSAFEPNVTGVTGIESADMIYGVAEIIKPDVMILIDALAAGSTEKIGRSIQISDTGISPGSGIGNKRIAINKESLGIPVIAIGIPMVTYASTVASDLIHSALGGKVEEELIENLVGAVIKNSTNLVVTPKEIDSICRRCAELLSLSINLALHEKLTKKEIFSYI